MARLLCEEPYACEVHHRLDCINDRGYKLDHVYMWSEASICMKFTTQSCPCYTCGLQHEPQPPVICTSMLATSSEPYF